MINSKPCFSFQFHQGYKLRIKYIKFVVVWQNKMNCHLYRALWLRIVTPCFNYCVPKILFDCHVKYFFKEKTIYKEFNYFNCIGGKLWRIYKLGENFVDIILLQRGSYLLSCISHFFYLSRLLQLSPYVSWPLEFHLSRSPCFCHKNR